MEENFGKEDGRKPEKLKKKAINLCESMGLDSLTKSIMSPSGLSLCAFFSAKTHQDGCPFRLIVSEKRSWQNEMGRYLQKDLSLIPIKDPFL
ncbi:hypothetical protein HPB48_003331 [Haemaphysalis longicornis]|uniref:Uncharacterized protein n=1 Tax=Haemaphysalis longicornis TaxID=44386 RepID=A0A9J6H4K8_HAELO|nr:hypothetical protein HPB48_003331 [Haemaphysalis longicornis]